MQFILALKLLYKAAVLDLKDGSFNQRSSVQTTYLPEAGVERARIFLWDKDSYKGEERTR